MNARAPFSIMHSASQDEVSAAFTWLMALPFKAQNLYSDTRELVAGQHVHDVFLALSGRTHSALQVAQHALQKGVGAIISTEKWTDCPVPFYYVPELAAQRGALAAAFYQHPSHQQKLIAVTGTNGKTSIVQWLGQVFSMWQGSAATLGTLGACEFNKGELIAPSAKEVAGLTLTTPDAVALQRQLAKWAHVGKKAVALEISSIGLEQGRAAGCEFNTAVFTNLSRDHLDYHGSMENYAAAKGQLFAWPNLQHSVINGNDPVSLLMLAKFKENKFPAEVPKIPRAVIYGFADEKWHCQGDDAVLQASIKTSSANGMVLEITSTLFETTDTATVRSQVLGRFNAQNLLAVLACLLLQGCEFKTACALLEKIQAAPGRLQRVASGAAHEPLVVVDYAHTPDALAQTLATLRAISTGKVICVFGCGGNRDAGKRPLMAQASLAADAIFVTSDNPRHESAQAILQDIVAGFTQLENVQVMSDRAAAILAAVQSAGEHDVVLIAGKGHETYQEIGDKKYPFSDVEHARLALLSVHAQQRQRLMERAA